MGWIRLRQRAMDLFKFSFRERTALPAVFEAYPKIRLKVAGRANDPDYFRQVQETARRLGVEERIEFLGHCPVDRLIQLYRTCALLVFPSTVETFGS